MIRNKFLVGLCVVSLYFTTLVSFSTSAESRNCEGKLNCAECIQTLGCQWCKAENITETLRCFSNQASTSCPAEMIENPTGFARAINATSSVESSYSSMSPSAYEVRLRVGETKTVEVTYTDEANRPLDLYILMDMSCTMKKQLKLVVNNTRELVNNLQELTQSDLVMGFGSFVDKPVWPYSMFKPEKNNISCEGEDISKVKPHLFRNHLSLTRNESQFIDTVNTASISSNTDAPEGGLDALMQAISCYNVTDDTRGVGWRSGTRKTRKLIVMSTDGPFHIAGDGRLGGILKPNDGKCHVDKDGFYTKDTELDYPSISQIRDKIIDNSVFVVFAVTDRQLSAYKRLVEAIGPEFASAQRINDKDSTVDVILSEYKKVVKKVSFLPVVNDYVDVAYSLKCPKSDNFVPGHECSELPPKAKVGIRVHITLKKCPTSKQKKTVIQVSPSDSKGGHNALRIDLDMLCHCECETPLNNDTQKYEERCSNHGYLQCGICNCDPKYGGPTCNCTLDDGETTVSQTSCMDSSGQIICSNQGDCVCGECKCKKGFGGRFCQCKTDECQCNVELGQGKCGQEKCDACECNPGFNGERCECPVHKKECKASSNSEICFGRGNCPCNSCECGESFHGRFCELQYTKFIKTGECDTALIKKMSLCVECLQVDNANVPDKYSLVKPKQKCHLSCEKANVTMVDRIGSISTVTNEWCMGIIKRDKNKETCDIIFQVGSRILDANAEPRVKVEIERNPRRETCVAGVAILPIILGLVGIVLLIGIVLLVIWKVLTYIHDKNEFSKFENETKGASWLNQNPLYRETVSEFQNPAYSTQIEDDKNK